MAWRLSFSTMFEDVTLAQLPPSVIKEHTFSWIVYREWKIFSLCSSLSPLKLLKVLLNTNNSTSSASSTTSSWVSSIQHHIRSSSSSSSLLVSHLAKDTILRFGHSEAICPRPWHLKQHLGVADVGLGRVWEVWPFYGAWGIAADGPLDLVGK